MGKSSKPIIGYHYRPAYLHGLAGVEIDAFLEFRAGDRTAWQGRLTASGTISVNAPNLFGGEKDQGGLVGSMDVMFGEPTQAVNPYLVATFGDKTPAWRGFTTVAWKGGRYGAMNPYPKPASYKVERILQGWDSGACWYPEKAVISDGFNPYITLDANVYAGTTPDVGLVLSGYAPSDVLVLTIAGGGNRAWAHWDVETPGTPQWHSDLQVTDADGITTTYFGGGPYLTQAEAEAIVEAGMPIVLTGSTSYTLWIEDTPVNDNRGGFSFYVPGGLNTINPAHVLYDSRTCSDMGREPTANINEASLQAAADQLFAEGFGICPKWDPASESVEDFENRICRLIGGSFSRSLEDGQWYLDLARGDYVLEDLPILTDDDILSFEEQPSTLDSAVNSVSVRYFDPQRKEFIVTPPVRALGLVAAFGTIHETLDFPEIPTGQLAVRVALRALLERTTPTRVFDLATTRRTRSWRPNTYFRLQTIKRGIADMVCVVGEKDSGTLKSGAIKMKATQEPSSLPDTSFVEVEPGVDTSPDQTPDAITLQRAAEAPYIEVVAAMSRADFAALPEDVGFAMAMAATETTDLDFSMLVDPDGTGYDEVGSGQWCATAKVVEAAPLDDGVPETSFTLTDGLRLDQVELGTAVLWDGEICRVNALDAGTGAIVLGRACADTTPAEHAAGSRLWFYQVGFAYDLTEYTDGETIDVKLLSNTGSQQLPEAAATAMPLTFDRRLARPYPPARLRFTGTLLTEAAYPSQLVGAITTQWAHRDRQLQADQLVDTDEASVGPEAGTTYTVTYEQPPGTVVNTQSGISGTSAAAYSFAADGPARIAVTAQRDGLDSWQALDHTFDYLLAPPSYLLLETGDFLLLETGDKFKLE